MGYIYKITNKINNKIYIGYTTQKLNVRYSQHLTSAFRKKSKTAISSAIRKYGKDNFILDIIEKTNVCKKELLELEVKYIEQYNSNNKLIGYNLTKGGESSSYIRTKETIEKMSKSMMGNKSSKGIPKTEEFKENLSRIRFNKFRSGKLTAGCLKCTIYDSNNCLLGNFYSIKEAARVLKLDQDTIRRASKGIKTRYKIKVIIH